MAADEPISAALGFIVIDYIIRRLYGFFDRIDLIQPRTTATMIKKMGIPQTYKSTAALSVAICNPPVSAPVKVSIGITSVVVAVCFLKINFFPTFKRI